jgi:hypothetical protein
VDGDVGKKVSKRFFFEKKKQKTFINRGRWPLHGQSPGIQARSFLLLFFKKEALASFTSLS